MASEKYEAYKKDTTRFIAHAGGKIGDFTYTNSLEALNDSYNKGFRYFELDIIETKEGEFVAAHDWKYWAEVTDYKKILPPTKLDFLQYPIREKYTPMDMKQINLWFKEHSDAILVTDKINKPVKFSSQFIEKKRLMMELFTWDAVKEATKEGIKSAIVSEIVLKKSDNKALTKLKEQKVNTVAVSRNFLNKNSKLIQDLKKNNIKVFIYSLYYNFENQEDYFVKYELDKVYGIYSDTWNFISE